MSTVLRDSAPPSAGPFDSALDSLRQRIRRFLMVRGVVFTLLALGLAFWVLMAGDRGVFLLTGVDWVQILPGPARGIPVLALLLVIAGYLTFRVILPAMEPLSRSGLALLLEKRYPGQLGQQLITAIDLRDPQEAVRRGYSLELTKKVMDQAAQAMRGAPVDQVLDWPRLNLFAGLALVVCLGPLPLVFGGAALAQKFSASSEGEPEATAAMGWAETSWILLERNLFLRDLIWPRGSFLILEGFPASGEAVIGQDQGQIQLRVRAVRHLAKGAWTSRALELRQGKSSNEKSTGITGSWPNEGWRPLDWFDLETLGLISSPDPTRLPEAWVSALSEAHFTVDALEALALSPGAQVPAEVSAALERLKAIEESSSLWWVKKMRLPTKVIARVTMTGSSNTSPMQPVGRQEFTALVKDLRESATFTIRGDDYETPAKRIRVIPPPRLSQLDVEEEHPAYLYFRPGTTDAQGPPEATLVGRRQRFLPRELLQPGSDQTRLVFPSGTHLKISAMADRALREIRLSSEPADAPAPKGESPSEKPKALPFTQIDSTRFQFSLGAQTSETLVRVEFVDDNGVVGSRRILLKPLVDDPPQVKAEPSPFLRRNDQGIYLVTPEARIPFQGMAEDRQGLGTLEHAWTVEAAEGNEVQIAFASSAIVRMSSFGLGDGFGAIVSWNLLFRNQSMEAKPREIKKRPVAVLEKAIAQIPNERLDRATVDAYLAKAVSLPFRDKIAADGGDAPPRDRQALLRKLALTPDSWEKIDEEPKVDFLMNRAGIVPPKGQTVPGKHRVDLWFEATDLDRDPSASPGQDLPHRSRSQEVYSFFVISEEDLLVEVRKDEIKAQDQLDAVKIRLINEGGPAYLLGTSAERKDDRWDKLTVEDWRILAGRFNRKADDPLDRVLEDTQKTIEDLLSLYGNLVRELELNRVTETVINQKRQIRDPLRQLRETLWPEARSAIEALRKAVEANEPDASKRKQVTADATIKLRAVTTLLEELLGRMGGVLDFDKELARAREIEKAEKAQFDFIQKLHEELVKRTLEEALNPKP